MKPRLRRFLILLLGIVIGQAVLYGPSLTGSKVLLPFDLLTYSGSYLPQTAETARTAPHNHDLSDLIEFVEPHREFLARELRAGRHPRWNPYQFAGAPDVRNNFSPFYLLAASVESPKVIAWVQLLAALVAGVGAYRFCRKALHAGFRASAVIGWCYPLAGFLIFWQGYPLEFSAVWLPWLLASVNRVARKPDTRGIAALGAVTTLLLISGQLDIALLSMMAAGIYGAWLCGCSWFEISLGRAAAVAGALALGWGLGILVAAPDILPMAEYSRTSERLTLRLEGDEERPPVGLSALPQIAWPTLYGSTVHGSLSMSPKNQPNVHESSAGAYAGLLVLLLAAPLGWCARKHRPSMIFFTGLAFFTLAWSLNIPGVVDLLRLPGFNLLSYNRFVFVTAFSILAMAAIGLDALDCGEVRPRRWFLIPMTLLALLLIWAVLRMLVFPEPVNAFLSNLAATDKVQLSRTLNIMGIRTEADLAAARNWFLRSNLTCATLAVLGILTWLRLRKERRVQSRFIWALGIVFVGDLLWFGFGFSAQCDPSLSYATPVPALKAAAQSGPGRFMGMNCLPANIGTAVGIPCIQGYDGVNPVKLMDLLRLAASPYANTRSDIMAQWFEARCKLAPPDRLTLPPILDMLNIRYVVFRGNPPAKIQPAFQSPDYWIVENRSALPRVFVPRRVESVPDPDERLEKLSAPGFNAREVAFIESDSAQSLPANCEGEARIDEEIPCRVVISAQMKTPGLVVLADLWDAGWLAWLDGNPVPIERANHALRGVVVPPGDHRLEFRYEPASRLWGWRAAGAGGLAMAGLLCFGFRKRRRESLASVEAGRQGARTRDQRVAGT